MGQLQHQRDDLARTATERIIKRAGRRIRGLVVSYRDGRVTVHGSADSYHAWQLAIAACRECLAEIPSVGLDFLLQVEKRSVASINRVQQLN